MLFFELMGFMVCNDFEVLVVILSEFGVELNGIMVV